MITPTVVTRTTPKGLTVFELRYDVLSDGPRYVAGPFVYGSPWVGFDDSTITSGIDLGKPVSFETEAEALVWLTEIADAEDTEALDEMGPAGGDRGGAPECDQGPGLFRGFCGLDGRPSTEN